MTGLERTLAALRGEPADRAPLTAWVFPFSDPAVLGAIRAKYGSEAAFFDALDIDFLQAFPEAWPHRLGERWGKFSLDEALAVAFDDPRDPASPDYRRLTDAVALCRPRGRAVLGNVTGVIEHADAFLGIEDMLLNLAAEPEKMAELFLRLGRWGARSVAACADLGADVIHISDDCGQNGRMLMRPETWRLLVKPADALIVQAAQARGLPVTLHSDGFIEPIIPDLIELGVNAVHPVQESAGMDFERFQENWGAGIGVYGGLDISYVLPFGTRPEIEAAVRRAFAINRRNCRYLFATAHMIQPDTSLDRVEFAYSIARQARAY